MRLCTLVLVILMACCKPPAPVGEKSGSVVLIFENMPENSRYTFSTGISTNNGGVEVQYIDDAYFPGYFKASTFPYDTLIIPTSRRIIEIQHAYRGADNLNFFFQKGDTVLFQYNGLKPIATVRNRITKNLDTSFELTYWKTLNDKFPATIEYQFPFAFYKTDKDNYETLTSSLKEKAFAELKGQQKFLDSLGNLETELSPPIKALYTLQNRFDSLRFSLVVNKAAGFPDRQLFQDSLLFYGFYHDFLDNLISYYYVGIENTKLGSQPDYKSAFDKIKSDTSYTVITKKVLLSKAVERIMQASDIESIKRYTTEFIAITGDTLTIAYLNKKSQINYNTEAQLTLIGVDSELTTLDGLIQRNRGKLIYVDFWASWCGPCITQFPSAEKLKMEYKGKDILFLYLSIDSDSVKWRKASEKFELENSYWIQNRFSSTLTDDLKVTSIPRYILFGGSGKIIHANAPRPEDKAIISLIESNLRSN